ncbi:hypothetical protein SO802_023610 [Lithocarpus litseifolius]|uniref:No apical meristem-associated C-terminal domain-containing protein n=1 Tax=Lithocarpus litseifolius TaxID=425828 RepID=A0AAW2C8P3_9ROSI
MDSDFVAPFLSGSQDTLMPIQESFPEVEIVTFNSTKRGGNFSVDEDTLLVSAWLNISIDAMQGTEQKAKKFWQKIWQYFCENNTYETTRSARSLQSRWGNISRETSRFAGFMAKVEARNKSGGTDEDKESQEQDKEALHIKADRIRVDAQRADIEKERLHLETIGLVQKADIEKERLRLETIREEGRIMTMDTSVMNNRERLYFENLKDQIFARQQLE